LSTSCKMMNYTVGNVANYSVKLVFNGEVRRFPHEGTTFMDLYARLLDFLALEKDVQLLVRYKDDEGDLITMSSDLELKEALRISNGLLHLDVYKKINNDAPKDPNVNEQVSQTLAKEPSLNIDLKESPRAFEEVKRMWKHQRCQMWKQLKEKKRTMPKEEWKQLKNQMKAQRKAGFAQFRCHKKAFKHGHHPGGHLGHHQGGFRHGHHPGGNQHWAKHWNPEYEVLADTIAEMGFNTKKKCILRMLNKHGGDVEKVTNILVNKRRDPIEKVDVMKVDLV